MGPRPGERGNDVLTNDAGGTYILLMGPHSGERGNSRHANARRSHHRPSMEPRSGERGNCDLFPAVFGGEMELQWGHAQMSAEILKAGKGGEEDYLLQ